MAEEQEKQDKPEKKVEAPSRTTDPKLTQHVSYAKRIDRFLNDKPKKRARSKLKRKTYDKQSR